MGPNKMIQSTSNGIFINIIEDYSMNNEGMSLTERTDERMNEINE